MERMIKKIENRIEMLKQNNVEIAESIVRRVSSNTRNRSNCNNLMANEEIIRELELVIVELKKAL